MKAIVRGKRLLPTGAVTSEALGGGQGLLVARTEVAVRIEQGEPPDTVGLGADVCLAAPPDEEASGSSRTAKYAP